MSVGNVGLGTTVLGLLAVFWVSVWLGSLGVPTFGVRILVGGVLLFVPGALLASLLDVGTDTGGRFALYSSGLGLALLATLTLLANAGLGVLGVENPLSFWPLAVLLTATTLALFALTTVTDGGFPDVKVDLVGSAPVLLLLFVLPTLSALGAAIMRSTGSNVGMYLFVVVVAAVVLLSATRVVRPNHYPVLVFFVAFSALLQVNLLTNHVVGNDIQSLYFSAGRIVEMGEWPIGRGGSAYALPVVTAVPGMVTIVTGMELWTTFTVVYVLLFSLVPVGIFYLGRRVFGARVGLFGALFFAFYHISLTYTPGKQLLAELFVVLLLGLYLFEGVHDSRRKAAALLLVLGLIFSHYATTLFFGLALLAATFGLRAVGRFVGPVDHRLSFVYPVVLLGTATAWYGVASQTLVDTLVGIPTSAFDQVVTLLNEGTISGGAGVTYIGQQTTPLEDLNLYIYVLMTVLIAFGIAWRTFVDAVRARRGEEPARTELTALAVPLFGFLSLSYVVILNLYADRVYQMVLTVLALFAAVGYRSFDDALGRVSGRFPTSRSFRLPWSLFAIVLVVLLALNSGLAFAALAESESATFNADAHDSVFSAGERAAADWLLDSTDIRPSSTPVGEDQLEGRDFPNRIPVFTDRTSYQLLRSILPTGYYNVETVALKTDYQPTIDYEQLDEGYVFVRKNAIRDANGRAVAPEYLSRREANAIAEPRNVVYSSGDVRIVAARYGPGANQTRDPATSVVDCRAAEGPPTLWRTGACSRED
ncbi:DUF2206 domain-containing protein [Halopelagius fulvigenes]|uniref:DUF2206 domain-containing protein n=1 Tax=Halopelagius fulvigenes TaxID=1198324 RepID=A0ABD5U1V8_9EURY